MKCVLPNDLLNLVFECTGRNLYLNTFENEMTLLSHNGTLPFFKYEMCKVLDKIDNVFNVSGTKDSV